MTCLILPFEIGDYWSARVHHKLVVHHAPTHSKTEYVQPAPQSVYEVGCGGGGAGWFDAWGAQGLAVAPVPEPATWLMLAMGLAAVGVIGRRRVR